MGSTRKILTVLIMFLPFVFTAPSMADTAPSGYGRHHEMKGGQCRKHGLSSDWRKTLTGDQKKKISRMHLDLARQMSKIEAALGLKTAELKYLVTGDSPDKSAVNRKIKEMIDLKEKMMQAKYAHIIEMRSVLSADQRVSFDTGLLKKGGFGHGKGHGQSHGKGHGMGGS